MAADDQYRTFWPRLGAAGLDGAALAPLAWVDQILWNVRVKILDYLGNRLTVRQAILRDILPVIAGLIVLVFVINNILAGDLINRGLGNSQFLLWRGFGGIAWGVLEFLTKISNSKRRAMHDYIAQTVVIRQPISGRWGDYRRLRWWLIALLVLHFIVPELLPEQGAVQSLDPGSNKLMGLHSD